MIYVCGDSSWVAPNLTCSICFSRPDLLRDLNFFFCFFTDDFRRTACTSILMYVLEMYGGDSEWERIGEVHDAKSRGMTHTNTHMHTLELTHIHTSSLLCRSE